MKKLSELIQKQMFEVSVRSPLNEQINAVMSLMGEDIHHSKRYAYWCGRLRRFKDRPEAIYEILKQAKTGRNPAALFQHLIKTK
jgi:hypothetical protein